MKGSQESALHCPAQKALETSSCCKQQSGKQMGGRGWRSLAKSRTLPLNYSETEAGQHSLQYCLSPNLSRQSMTLGKGQPQRAEEGQLPQQHGAPHRAGLALGAEGTRCCTAHPQARAPYSQQALEKSASQPGLHTSCFLILRPPTNKSLYKHSNSEGIILK